MDQSKAQRWLEHAVHWTLIGGLALSVALLVSGLVWTFVGGQASLVGRPLSFGQLGKRIGQMDSAGLLDLGLLVLIGTPILRVVALAIGWSVERESRFALVAFGVLGLLILSLAMGLH